MKNIFLNSIKRLTFLVIALLVLGSCNEDTPDRIETASVSFSISSNDILVSQNVSFNIQSTNVINGIEWDFGDGTTSTLQSPSHAYAVVGDYVVTLTYKEGTVDKIVPKKISVSLSNDINGTSTLKEKLASLNDKILVCAHRATASDKPENSLSAIQNAIDENIEIVELDIRETKDGELVLMHDATLQRTTTGTGNVNSFTLQELKQYNLEKENGALTTEKIPTLKEVFDLARGKIYINLDLDEKAAFEKVYTVAKQYGMLKQVMFYTKDNSVIRTILRTNVDLVVLPFIDDETELNSFSSSNLNIVHYSTTSFNTAMVQNANNKSIGVYANVYVNTSTTPQSDNNFQIDRFIALKGNVIQTDHPTYIKKYLQQKKLN